MIKSHTAKLNEIPLHYAEAPGPGPALVILHGLSGSHAEFLPLVPALAAQAHVYVLDLRGHGLSGRGEAGAYHLADYGRDVAAFLRQEVGEPAVLLGHSLGGLVAIWLGAHAPELVRGLVLSDPALYIIQMPRFGQTDFYPYFSHLRAYLSHYHANGASVEDLTTDLGQTPVSEEQTWLDVAGPDPVRERAIQLDQFDPAALTPALAGTLLEGHEPDDLLVQIRCPVHLIAARAVQGGAMEADDVRRAVSKLPHCTHTVIENAGHDIHLDQPEAFKRILKRFLVDLADRSHSN
ncbi:MAG TPA: alpha/beta hydrolase [Anaerolineae bacterium]|nr:alpha/beta hydrolase [Anaerolineae bacterium]